MRNKGKAIPVHEFLDTEGAGMTIEKISFDQMPELADWEQPERHNCHSFFLLERGRIAMEIDFHQHEITAPSVMYMHPDQVHRMDDFEEVTLYACAINDDNLRPGYLKLLGEITPVAPMMVQPETFTLLAEAATLAIKLAAQPPGPLHQQLLQDACNMLVGSVISLYQQAVPPADKTSRPETITRLFREALATHYAAIKRPADYAAKLHITPAYLNECVKNITGRPVSYHIQQRVVLEAKRMLYHSNQSLKEIAATLGYDDYPYFSRLFTKIAGKAPLSFRHKNPG